MGGHRNEASVAEVVLVVAADGAAAAAVERVGQQEVASVDWPHYVVWDMVMGHLVVGHATIVCETVSDGQPTLVPEEVQADGN